MMAVFEEDIQTIGDNIKDIVAPLSGKTLLITGGAGFLGNYFISVIDYLNRNHLTSPCKIISVDNFVTGVKYRLQEGENFRAIQHNVKDPLKIDEPVDYIIHAAGIASPKFYREFKLETMDVATMGTRNMLELAKEKKVASMLFFSSSEIYGDPDPQFIPTPETYWGNVSCTGTRSNYDESKRYGETLSRVFFEMFGTPVKAIRPFNIYGPGMRLDDYRVIPNFVSHMFENKPLPVYGPGNHTRTFCYITDGMEGFLRVLLQGEDGEAFNVGTDKEEISIAELARIFSELYGDEVKMDNVEGINDAYTKDDPKRRCPDITKLKQLGYTPKVDLRTGIKRFVSWAKESS